MIQNHDAYLFNHDTVAAPLTGICPAQVGLKCYGFRETMILGERMYWLSEGDYR